MVQLIKHLNCLQCKRNCVREMLLPQKIPTIHIQAETSINFVSNVNSTYNKLLVNTKNLSDVTKDALDVFMIKYRATSLDGVLKRLLEDLRNKDNHVKLN